MECFLKFGVTPSKANSKTAQQAKNKKKDTDMQPKMNAASNAAYDDACRKKASAERAMLSAFSTKTPVGMKLDMKSIEDDIKNNSKRDYIIFYSNGDITTCKDDSSNDGIAKNTVEARQNCIKDYFKKKSNPNIQAVSIETLDKLGKSEYRFYLFDEKNDKCITRLKNGTDYAKSGISAHDMDGKRKQDVLLDKISEFNPKDDTTVVFFYEK